MFKCYQYERVFEEPEYGSELLGEYFGVPASIDLACCPFCKGEFEEVVQCAECGEWCFEDDLDDGICENCIEEAKEEYHTDIKKCLDILKDEKKQIEINPVLAMLLKPSVIEQILTEYVLNNSFDCKEVVEQYEDWFIEEIKKGVEK